MDGVLKFRAGDDLRAAVMEKAAEADVTVSQYLRDAVAAYDPPCGECDVCGLTQLTTTELDSEPTATIYGYGKFSETQNPEVQAVIDRAKELLREGAVGVSVATDMNPADMPLNPDDIDDDTLANA